MGYVARYKPGLEVYVGCCDDASADATPDYIADYFRGRDWFQLVRNRVNHYIGFSRNVAASQFATDLVCLLDADDEYKEDHLFVCADVMEKGRDPLGKKFLAACTMAEFSTPVHPDWTPRLSGTIPITKVVHRTAWEFVEGMSMEGAFPKISCEDQFLMQKLSFFFNVVRVANVTVRYWNYPGSFFDRQLHKFTKPATDYDPRTDEPEDLHDLHALRVQVQQFFLNYLSQKFVCLRWKEKLQEYSVRFPYAAGVGG
jgi:glycosyltransferase involved in cell wall biosynthesis